MRAADSKLALRATWLATRAAAAVSPALAGPVAAKLWFTPWRVPPGERGLARQAEWLKDTEPVSFDTTRGRLAGFAAGSGPVVLLVHGWGERAASLGSFIAPLVAGGYRVVGLDLPAHGGSPGRRTDGFEVAGAIREVSDSLGGVHAVIGHSMGAMTTVYAASRGMDAGALVLVAPSARLDHAFDTFTKLFRLPPNATAGLKALIARRYGADVWKRFNGNVLALEMEVPVLIVHDNDDPQVALDDAEELAAAWPGARLVTTEGLGHGRILRDPKVVEEVVSFLRTVPHRAGVVSGAAGA
jgi:pimeloyl-ACP methyl ester carboxylesterase